tara:strand:+ start:786 stop:920 length:135 start_codon:yes stop_codon:yes gene_type:complete
MGCGCNKKVQKEKPVSKARTVLRKMWQKSQSTTKPLKVKEINKP